MTANPSMSPNSGMPGMASGMPGMATGMPNMMTTASTRTILGGRVGPRRGSLRDRSYQAYLLLWLGFSVLPILFGVDKFYNWMVDWPKYLWVGIPNFFGRYISNVTPQHFMYAVGVIEIAAGVLVFLFPRIASYILSLWLAGIVADLVVLSVANGHAAGFWDIALRDFGLFVAAFAFARMGKAYAPNPFRATRMPVTPTMEGEHAHRFRRQHAA